MRQKIGTITGFFGCAVLIALLVGYHMIFRYDLYYAIDGSVFLPLLGE